MLGPFLLACVLLIHTASSAPVAQFGGNFNNGGRVVCSTLGCQTLSPNPIRPPPTGNFGNGGTTIIILDDENGGGNRGGGGGNRGGNRRRNKNKRKNRNKKRKGELSWISALDFLLLGGNDEVVFKLYLY